MYISVPAGRYLLGDAFDEGYSFDHEGPQREVSLSEYDIDQTPVTNVQFELFVADTGYVTTAERLGSSAVFHLAVMADRRDVLSSSPRTPWWIEVRNADWRHPFGAKSDLHQASQHPVVHVSWHDAAAYAEWAGRALPTEAQWEAAARGGLTGARYAWGDDLTPDGQWRCNIWQGDFPTRNTANDGWRATSPVHAYPPNGFGIYDMSGNVWEWCTDWYDADRRSIRGGSYLCHESYCNRYRVAARSGNTPFSTSGNCGFRTVSPAAPGVRRLIPAPD